jgi:hypothetical protein
MAERVDKKWAERGLDQYSLEAIFGTLAHYGVALDEAGYRALAKDDFPIAIATRWHDAGWKGTGQFSRFPAAAAEELWRRFFPGQLTPADVALATIHLLQSLDAASAGKADDGTLDTRFKVVESFAPKLPEDAARRRAFLRELELCLAEWRDVFDVAFEELTAAKLPGLADRFVAVEERLYPERAGLAAAWRLEQSGDVEAAAKAYLAIAGDAARAADGRYRAIAALFELDREADATPALLAVLDEVTAAQELDLAAQGFDLLLERLGRPISDEERKALKARANHYAGALGLDGRL